MRVVTALVILFFVRLFGLSKKNSKNNAPFTLKLKLISDIWEKLSELSDITAITYASIYKTSKLDKRKSTLYYSIPEASDSDDHYGNMVIKEINLYEDEYSIFYLYISMKSDMSVSERVRMNILISKLKYIFATNKKDLSV